MTTILISSSDLVIVEAGDDPGNLKGAVSCPCFYQHLIIVLACSSRDGNGAAIWASCIFNSCLLLLHFSWSTSPQIQLACSQHSKPNQADIQGDKCWIHAYFSSGVMETENEIEWLCILRLVLWKFPCQKSAVTSSLRIHKKSSREASWVGLILTTKLF